MRLRTPVVLEHEAADGGHQNEGTNRDDPPVGEGKAHCNGDDHGCDGERPDRARREEAELTGAVGNLGVLVILGQRADSRVDEVQVAGDEEAQQR